MEKENAEIEKLAVRIAKDPKSKLFVPLAEEYKKAGDIETAVRVLTEGLKHNPGYVTARSFLGRLLMEKGDLAGAQKELEEVIKTIPDNLLAQRKLGDIYVLQGRVADAVQRYKAALALNPGDKDLPSLLAGLEAGKETSFPTPVPPPAPSAEKRPQSSPAASVQLNASPNEASGAAGSPESASTVHTAPGPQAGTKGERTSTASVPPVSEEPASLSAPDEAEIIEDIVEIESLDQTIPEPPSEVPSSVSVAASGSFNLGEPLSEKTSVGSVGDKNEAVSWNVPDTAVPERIELVEPDEGRDDLNTSTLAELYISQGFYDKAIEVYQGMLNDRPGNTALQQKLEHIRAMAGVADGGQEQLTEMSSGPGEYAPPAEDVFTTVPDKTMAPSVASSPAKDALPLKEMIHREQVPQMNVKEPSGEPDAPRRPQAATTRRKETIDRLESWLNTIMKEKQE